MPRDVVSVQAGHFIAANYCLLSAKKLFVNQLTLIGTTFPVEKHLGWPD